jgi:hypothetical protein
MVAGLIKLNSYPKVLAGAARLTPPESIVTPGVITRACAGAEEPTAIRTPRPAKVATDLEANLERGNAKRNTLGTT